MVGAGEKWGTEMKEEKIHISPNHYAHSRALPFPPPPLCHTYNFIGACAAVDCARFAHIAHTYAPIYFIFEFRARVCVCV